ncbi:MAG: AAA family ATPase [Sandaracinaceae bacterium]
MKTTTKRSSLSYACASCGHRANTLWDRCPECLAFGSFCEADTTTPDAVRPARGRPPGPLPAPLSGVSLARHPRRSSELGELDRVLGRGPNGEGLAAGQVLVLGGSPGVGKSTLLMQALAGLTAAGGRALYASGEETREQIAERAHRLGLADALARIDVLDTHQVEHVDAALRTGGYVTAVVDSLQTFTADDLGDPGTTRTVAVVAERLTSTAKSLDVSLWLVGQATKDGRLAGPNAAAHVVDTLLWFEREHGADFRVLRAGKNRFGSVGEVGLFRMDAGGLHDVADPSSPLVRRRSGAHPVGAVWAAVADADRPVLVEVQALVSEATDSSPKRVAVGLDAQRLALVMAVLGRHAGVELEGDVFLDVQSPTGRLSDRGLDLPIALALASAARGSPVPADLACCGKLSLTGEVLPPLRLDARLSEMRRLGFSRLLVPLGGGAQQGDGTTEVATLAEAIALALGGAA